MKHFIAFFIFAIIPFTGFCQESRFMTFEFMKVDESQGSAYLATEDFWEGIHKERLMAEHILGWELWSLQPGGEDQGYQYLTVTYFATMEDMLTGLTAADGLAHAKKAYPKKSSAEVEKLFNQTAQSRDLGKRYFLSQIDATDENTEIVIGAVARINFMHAIEENYETMESMVFKPWHQRLINHDVMSKWVLLRIVFPLGSNQYASHITVDYFKNIKHFVDSIDFDFGDNSVQNDLATEEGLKTRDHKEVLLGTLLRIVQ